MKLWSGFIVTAGNDVGCVDVGVEEGLSAGLWRSDRPDIFVYSNYASKIIKNLHTR